MPVVKITPARISGINGSVVMPVTVAVDAADGALIPFNAHDGRTAVIVENAAAAPKTVTFVAGDAIGAEKDMTVSVKATTTMVFVVESGRFKIVSGANKGSILVKGESADIKVAAVMLP